MASSSAPPASNDHVFLSFRGEDTRKTIVSHLYAALESRGIVTFKDDQRLEIRDDISTDLRRALEGSRFAVVVLSENYATSRWCLMELQLIIEFMMEGRLEVIPVFYGVDPSVVRHQRESFALETYHGPEMADKFPGWKEALNLVADLPGVDSRSCVDEAMMVEDIARTISRRVTLVHDSGNIIGMKAHMEGLSHLLDLESVEVRDLDVFLSFSGKIALDVHFAFVLSQNGIKSFESESWKENSLKPIDPRTREALTESKVAVVMTSDQEASSVGFLEELIVILESQEKHSLTVIPIFLTEHPLDVEIVSQMFPERAQIWRTAIAKLNGIASQKSFSRNLAVKHETNRIKQIADDIRLTFLSYASWDQANRIKQIADDITLMFLSSASSDIKGLAGMDRHMKAFYELLALESDKEIRTIGIWGSPGVGKTTLARYTYAEISDKFQAHFFLDNVENTKEMFLSQSEFYLTSLDEINEMTEAKEKHQKVLLIADGVNNIEQGKWIAEYAKWFAPGSRVILITHERRLLLQSGVNHVYEVGSLRYDEAFQLFSRFAFKQPYPPPDFERLSVLAVQLAGFVPMSIRLLGSFLTGRDKREWEATLLKLNAKQGTDFIKVWKIMEALEDNDIVEASKINTV